MTLWDKYVTWWTVIVAIDPGLSGGIAWRDQDGEAGAVPMPDTEGDIADVLRTLKVRAAGKPVAVIEDVPWVVGTRVNPAATAKLHRNVGYLHGVLHTLGFPIIRVLPRTWQSAFGLGTRRAAGSDTVWKNKLKAEAQRRYPALDVTLKTADALLLLDYAERSTVPAPSNPGPFDPGSSD